MDTQALMNRISENLSVRRAFGDAYEKDGLLVIPVALVAGGGGGGEGTMPKERGRGPGPVPRPSEDTLDRAEDGAGSGSGGGFGGLVMPIGAYVVKGDQVRWVPSVDVTVLILASLSVVRILGRLWTHGHRHHAHLKGSHRSS
jgi:uncharacterized spore protein YtfJ